MINLVLMGLGGAGLIIQLFTRTKQEHEKSLGLVTIQYLIMGSIIFLGGYSQFSASEKDTRYKRALLDVDVLSQVSELYFPVIDDISLISNNILTVKHYLSFEQSKKNHPNIAMLINWHNDATSSQKMELEAAQKSFYRINRAAKNIYKISIEHDGVIPEDTMEWVNSTLKMNFSEIEDHFDSFSPVGDKPKISVLNYYESTGKAFGTIIGRIRAASKVLRE